MGRKNYDDAKLSDYDSVSDFLRALMNLAHLVNNEMQSTVEGIEDRTIAMRIIHSFPPSMRTLQMTLIESAPDSNDMTWDLDPLKKRIEANECCARENLGAKLDAQYTRQAVYLYISLLH